MTAEEAQGQACTGPGSGQGWVRRAGRAGQSLSTAPGSSLVSVCHRSILLSLFFRQSNQCFRRSPLALMPRTTPPAEGSPRHLTYDSQGPLGTVPPRPSLALCCKASLSTLPTCSEGRQCSDHHILRPSYCPPPPLIRAQGSYPAFPFPRTRAVPAGSSTVHSHLAHQESGAPRTQSPA